MLSPRVYWLCPHETLRYEEVPLLIEAGAEVIPNLGDNLFLKYYGNYNNENHKLYPLWRKTCTLPTNIVEKIREIEIWEKRGIVNADEAELINRWIDVIFVATFPDILENISKWYQGYVVFRVFGWNDGRTTYTEVMNKSNINIDKLVVRDKYVWAPILDGLDAREDSRIIKNKFYLNAFVSKERVRFKWKGKESKPFISTLVSNLDLYYNGNPVVREIFESFVEKFSDIPFVVLGKNSKNAVKGICDKVMGHVDDNSFYSKIAESRIFVYFGLHSDYHLHFTPIEAMSMGVPVIFLERSGLAQEARDYGVSNEKLKDMGMCTNTEDMQELALKIMNNFHALEKMSRNQFNVFGKIFSREAAIIKAQNFFDEIQPYIVEHRKIEYTKPISFNIIRQNSFAKNSIQTDLPTTAGQSVVFSSERIKGFSGKLIYDHQGSFIARRVEQGIDVTGLFIANYIGKMQPGEYLFSMELNSFEKYNSSIGYFLMGAWNSQFTQFKTLSSINVTNLKKGKNTIRLAVNISSEDSDVVKEIRLAWNGVHTCEVHNIIVKKLT